jgi:hypothetical protein
MSNKRKKWRLVTDYNVTHYQCGLTAGDHVLLRHDIIIRDRNEVPTGEIYHAGEIWMVLHGSSDDPGVVWLRQPDNQRHTWTDDETIYDTFERVIEKNVVDQQKPTPNKSGNDSVHPRKQSTE